MKLLINSKKQEYEQENLVVSDIFSLNHVKNPDMVTVQLNGSFIQKENYDNTEVKNEDVIDFLYFMGGGKQKTPCKYVQIHAE